MGDLHDHRHAAQQDDLVAPVELVGFSWSEAQRNKGRSLLLARAPWPIAARSDAPHHSRPHIRVRAVPRTAGSASDVHEMPSLRSPTATDRASPATANLRQRLLLSLVTKLSRLRSNNLPNDLPRYAQLTADRLDRLALFEKRAANFRNRFHDQHPNLGFQEPWKPVWTLCAGVPIGCRSPRKGGPYSTPKHTQGCDGLHGCSFPFQTVSPARSLCAGLAAGRIVERSRP